MTDALAGHQPPILPTPGAAPCIMPITLSAVVELSPTLSLNPVRFELYTGGLVEFRPRRQMKVSERCWRRPAMRCTQRPNILAD